MKTMTKLTEEQQADIVDNYLSGLEQGDAFNIPTDIDDSELVEIMKLAKDLRVENNPGVPSDRLLSGFTRKNKHRLVWKLLIPLPIMGAALLVVLMLTLQQPANTVHLSDNDINDVETQLAEVQALDQELEVTLADLDTTLSEVDEILADDSFTDIEAAINDSAL